MKIGIKNCRDLFNKLIFEKERLESSWSDYDFFNFVVTAWHLQNDWLKNNKENRPKLAMRKINTTPEDMKEVINIARDIANGSKHFKLDAPSEEKRVVTEVHPAEIKDWHSYFFGPKPAISTTKSYYSVADFSYLITEYFKWLFNDSESAKHLPESIRKHLDRAKKSKPK